jgi:hypothetical protein
MAHRVAGHTCDGSIRLYILQTSASQYVCSVTGNSEGHCMSLFRRGDRGKVGGAVNVYGKVRRITRN